MEGSLYIYVSRSFLGDSQTTFGAGNTTQHCSFSNKYPVNEIMMYVV